MSLESQKWNSTDITSHGVVHQNDILTGTTTQNKMVFDELIREALMAKYNALIDALQEEEAASQLGFTATDDIDKDNVQDAIEYVYDYLENEAEEAISKSTEEALVSEGYAVGKQDGEDVPSTSPYYHNNAKYYSDNAASLTVGKETKGYITFGSDTYELVLTTTDPGAAVAGKFVFVVEAT